MIPVFVNDRMVSVEAGVPASQAAAAAGPDVAAALAEGRAYLTDGRGIRVDAEAPVHAGAILRVIVSARQADPGPA